MVGRVGMKGMMWMAGMEGNVTSHSKYQCNENEREVIQSTITYVEI